MTALDPNLAEAFRTALRGVGSSVTIISTEIARIRYGMVATAVMSLSVEPPSLVAAVNRSTSIHDRLEERGAFAINILSSWDEPVARGFSQTKGEDRFAFGPWSSRVIPSVGTGELPCLANAQAVIFCRLHEVHRPYGTHSLFMGEVVEVHHTAERSALLYCDGAYGSFTPSSHL